MKKKAAEIVRFKGFNLDSDVFTEAMDMLEADRASAKLIISAAADMMLGGGAKAAFTVVHPIVKKWIVRRNIVELLGEKMPELAGPIAVGGTKFTDVLSKIIAKGLIKDIYESPYTYRRVMDEDIFSQFEKIVSERGKQKLMNVLKNRGIESSETKVASIATFTQRDVEKAARKARVKLTGGQGGSSAVPGYTWFFQIPGIRDLRRGKIQLRIYDDGSPADLISGFGNFTSIRNIRSTSDLVAGLASLKEQGLEEMRTASEKVARDLVTVAKELVGATKKEITLKIILSVDDEKTVGDDDPLYIAQEALLKVIPNKIAKGVTLNDARIIKGLVDREGVNKS